MNKLPTRHRDEGPAGSLVVVFLRRWWPLVALAALAVVATVWAWSTKDVRSLGFSGPSPSLLGALLGPFVHASVLHLLGNLAVGGVFAAALVADRPDRAGLKTLGLVALFSVGAAAGEVWWWLGQHDATLVGASAGIAAWVGAAARRRVPRSWKLWAAVVAVLVLGAVAEPASGAVHAVGFAVGFAATGWPGRDAARRARVPI